MYLRLSHKNVVQCLGSHYDPNERSLFIFLEFVAGGSIAKIMSTFGALGEEVVRSYTRDICHGLVYLHQNR